MIPELKGNQEHPELPTEKTNEEDFLRETTDIQRELFVRAVDDAKEQGSHQRFWGSGSSGKPSDCHRVIARFISKCSDDTHNGIQEWSVKECLKLEKEVST